jgi:predicted glutamine amidotransferase
MARLFGLIGNRPDLAGRVLALESEALCARTRGSPLGWGLGFYQGGEVLMRRRPIDDREEIQIDKLAADVRADVLLGHVRSATVGALRTENTHPFRYRQWLFAQTGTLAEFDSIRERLLASVPEFLRGNVRGETDSEIVFHLFLSFLHDAGKLDNGSVTPEAVLEALRSSIAVIEGMAAEVGGDGNEKTNLIVSNGDMLVAVHKNAKMSYRTFGGKNDAEMILGDDAQLRRRVPDLSHMHFTLIASDLDEDLPPRWKPVPMNSVVTMTRGDAPKIESI